MTRLIKNLDNKKGFLTILTSLRQQRYKSLEQGQSAQDQTWSNSGNKTYQIKKINLTNMSYQIDTQMSLEELNRVICILIEPSPGIDTRKYWITVSYNDITQITHEATSTPNTVIYINPQVNIQYGYIPQEQITLDSDTLTKKNIEDHLFTFLFEKLKNCILVNETKIKSIEIFDDETTQLYHEINSYTTTTPSVSVTHGGKKSLRKKDKRRKKKKTLRRNRKNRKGL